MRYTGLFFSLVTIAGFLELLEAEQNNNDLEIYCNATGISQEELEDEANSVGVTSKQLLEMIKAEGPLFEIDVDRNITTEGDKNLSSTFSHYGDEDVLGFILSSSFSDINESMVHRNVSSANESEARATILSLKTEAGSETNNIKANGNERDLGSFITVPARISIGEEPKNNQEIHFSEKVESSNINRKKRQLKKYIGNEESEISDQIKRPILTRIVKGRNYHLGKEHGRRYFIIGNKGLKGEYKVVKYLPSNRHSRERKPRRVRVVRRVIQPLIVAQTGSPAPLQQGSGMFITPPVTSIPNTMSVNGNNVVFPPGPASIQNQGQYNLQQNGDLHTRINDEHEFSDRRDNGHTGGNTLLGPMTVAVIVIILLVMCVIGGFCFCGTKQSGNNQGYMPIPPPPPPPPPHGNLSKHPPPIVPHIQYKEQPGAKAPLIPQHPASTNQSNQVFGYAIIPRI
ncbi:transmembrane protein [Cryptosporidium xiaoi]|uniref:Transmembrane protein n=1 Tax=Cryptosporidium xiaoi TaxID=659607 RepID=A0AAV9XUY9_9CRYT